MRRWRIWAAALAAILGYFYLPNLGERVWQSLPYLILLLCPFLHFLGGHGGHRHHGREGQPNELEGDKPS